MTTPTRSDSKPQLNPVSGSPLTVTVDLDYELAIEACRISLAQETLLDFISYGFTAQGKEFIVGRHTRELCARIDRALEDLFRFGISSRIVVTLPFRHGKALHVDTPIPTPSGFRRMEELQPGDEVFDETGRITRIVAVTPVQKNRPLVRVRTDDGFEILCDEEHEWVARLDGKRPRFRSHVTKDLLKRQERDRLKYNNRAPMVHQSGYVCTKDPENGLPIDPWMLGFWLGDGSSYRADITVEDRDLPYVKQRVELAGYRLSDRSQRYSYGVVGGLHNKLKELGLYNNKHVPDLYKWASPEARLRVLHGLMDSDGHIAKDGQGEFCSISKTLAQDVRFLINSLGYKASMIEGDAILDGRFLSKKYRVMFYMPISANLLRKAERTRESKRRGRYLTFEPAGRGDVKCIQVASDFQQFLCTEGFIPTHNSEIVSRYLVPYIIGKYSDPRQNLQSIPLEFMLGTYGASLSKKMSRDSRRLFKSRWYARVFPDVSISKESSAVDEWDAVQYDEETGDAELVSSYSAIGLGGGATGKGASIQIIDDYLKNREEAESLTTREKQWESYTNDFLTRLAPIHLHFVVATRWHTDDIIGRIQERIDPLSQKYDPEFPSYDVLHYKARQDDGTYLFPERFSEQWYVNQFATLGPYSAPALLQGEPIARGGNILPVGKINLVNTVPLDLLDQIHPVRFWDLASTEKEQVRDDPDRTVGARGFVIFPGATRNDDESALKPHFFVTDVRMCALLATARNDLIIESAKSDGPKVWQGVESAGGYKDAATSLKTILRGLSIVHPVTVTRDKFSRAEVVHPVMDAGRVYFVRGWWNTEAMTEMSQFPSGKHDDIVDAISGLYKMAYDRALQALRSGYLGGVGLSSGRGLMLPTDPTKGKRSSEGNRLLERLQEFLDSAEKIIDVDTDEQI